MENQYQKWVNLSYLAFAFALAYLVYAVAGKFSGMYDLEVRVHNLDLVTRGVSVAAGAILFLVLYRHERVNQFMNEVMVELSRVTWPTQKETSSSTMIVIVMVLISGMVLGLLDYVWTMMLKWVL